VAVLVVGVRPVSMVVPRGIVTVRVTVLSEDDRIVSMVVVFVVVVMGMVMLDGLMHMAVAVPLGEMEIDAGAEENAGSEGGGCGGPFTEQPCHPGADERSQSEDRAGAAGTHPPLGEQVEA
jgi:hypothetical protein